MLAIIAFAPALPCFAAIVLAIVALLALARPTARPWENVPSAPHALGIVARRSTARAVKVVLATTSAPRPLVQAPLMLTSRDKRGACRKVADACRAAVRFMDAWEEYGDIASAFCYDADATPDCGKVPREPSAPLTWEDDPPTYVGWWEVPC